ncbi:FecCD family ABC transporter permease [Agrilactobacillus fermenti]|uniref:FecCD family ABC transporter permease n=1 Tax=Agrilactobacillus fermenti TaxID=2586909 RepID=UPI003A5C3360
MTNYRSQQRFYRILVVVALALLVIMIAAALCVGRYFLPLTAVWQSLVHVAQPINPANNTIVWQLRLPRILGACLIGASLSLSGGAYQSIFQNPLVSPDLLGVTTGAAVGAASAIIWHQNTWLVMICAFVTGLLTVLITVSVPRFIHSHSNLTLVLAGVVVGGFMTAILGLLKYIADPESQLQDIVYWQLGSLEKLNYHTLAMMLPIFVVAGGLLLALRFRLNVLSLSDMEAQTTGVNVKWERLLVILCATLLTAAAVAISGTIGWIGLIMPHIAKLLTKQNNQRALPLMAILGAMFLLLVDTLARTISAGEIPIGILTGLIGTPFFIGILAKQRGHLT